MLFGPEKYYAIYKRIRCLTSQKSVITYVFSHNNAKIKVDSLDSLPLEKTLTSYDFIILIKSVFNKDKNSCYYHIYSLRNVHINNINMLYYDKIDVSEGIDINKISASKEHAICHYRHFLDKGFKFQPYLCNGCHNVLMILINLNDSWC